MESLTKSKLGSVREEKKHIEMASKIYRQILTDRIEAFLKESKSADLVNHLGLRGNIRESGLGKLIKDLLPVDWGIGSGVI